MILGFSMPPFATSFCNLYEVRLHPQVPRVEWSKVPDPTLHSNPLIDSLRGARFYDLMLGLSTMQGGS